MKRVLFIFLLVCINLLTFAQQDKGKVIGIVKDANSNPIVYAGVTIFNSVDSTLIKGTLTETDGTFEISGIKNGTYFIKIFFLGYEDWYGEPFQISASNSSIDLHVIQLKQLATTLKMAEVSFTKPLFEEKQGKMIMNVEAQPNVAGDNVLELLRKMPSVTVDYDDNISILGKSGVMIMIDDKPTQLSGDDLINLLKSIPSASVERVEVIKNPSSRFDAAGTAGIINIVTKKNMSNGINGSVYAGGGYSGSWQHNEGFNLTARLKKIVFNASYYYMNFKSKNSEETEDITSVNGFTTRMLTNENKNELWGSKTRWQSHGYNIGFDYYIDKKNTIGFAYRGNISLGDWISNSFIRLYTLHSTPDSSYQRNSIATHKSNNHTFNIDYKHDFDTLGKKLFANLTYGINDGNNISDNLLSFFLFDFTNPAYKENRLTSKSGPNLMQVVAAKIDYEHPVNDAISLEMGVKSSYIFNNNQSYNFLNDSCLTSQSNKFNYRENINAAYILFNATANKTVNIQMGLRAEYSLLEGLLRTTNERHQQRYIDLFPSFELSYQLPKMQILSFSYRNRISRPAYSVLNPFVSIRDQYNISTGNPLLAPEYSHHIEVNYSWKYSIFTSLSYNFSKGEYTDVQYTDPVTLIRTTRPENIGRTNSIGASIYARIPVGKWWLMNYSIDGNVGKTFFDYGSKVITKNIYFAHLFSSQLFTFLKNYSIELSIFGMPPMSSIFGKSKGLFSVNAGFKASFFKQSLTIKLSLNDIFNQGIWSDYTVYPDGSSTKSTWRWESRRLWLQLSYRFGKQDLKLREKRTNDIEELQRMGGGTQDEGKGGFQQPK